MYTIQQLEKKIREKAILFKNETNEDKKFEIYKDMVWIQSRVKQLNSTFSVAKIIKLFEKRNNDLIVRYDMNTKAFGGITNT